VEAARLVVAGLRALALAACCAQAAAAERSPAPLPFAPGERITLKITYARLLAGRATASVVAEERDGRRVLRFVAAAKSQGFFAWLFRFRVDDLTHADWDPASRCSLGIEKRLREGKARRDQVVRIDPRSGVAEVEDAKIEQKRFQLEPCTLDVLSALYLTRIRGVPGTGRLELPVFDNGKHYALGVKLVGRERLDLPAPFGKKTPTLVVEPQLLEGTGLFVKEGRLKIWLTDDARRVPVRMRSKVAIGSVSADLEKYEPG
jgi:hypothetical protein